MMALQKMARSLAGVTLALGCTSMLLASTGCMVGGDEVGDDQSSADLSVEARDCGRHGGFFAQGPAHDAVTGAVISDSYGFLGARNGWAGARVVTNVQPGEAVTLWLVGYNHPENCANPGAGPLPPQTLSCSALDAGPGGLFGQWLDGAVAGSDGSVVLQGSWDPSADSIPFAPEHVWDGDSSDEFSLVVRSHGPASSDPDLLNEQLTTFNGGNCPDPAPVSGDCHDEEYVHLY